MQKIIISICIFFLVFFGVSSVFSVDVDDLFDSLDIDYEKIDELQYLYANGIKLLDDSAIFNPGAAMKRSDFSSEAFKLSCESCHTDDLSPGIALKHVSKNSFFDVDDISPHFFCSEEADARVLLLRKINGFSCSNGEQQSGSSPFCLEDDIQLQEAVRYLLLLTDKYNEDDYSRDIDRVNSGEFPESLGNNSISFRFTDGTINPYYLYVKKALEYSIDGFDPSGAPVSYDFLDFAEDGSIDPERALTKDDFVTMAYMLLVDYGCTQSPGDFATLVDLYPSSCTQGEECEKDALVPGANSYDLIANYGGVCSLKVDEEKDIIWIMTHEAQGIRDVQYGAYLDNYNFTETGLREIYLGVKDRCGQESHARSQVYVGEGGESLSIEASPMNTELGNTISLRALSTDPSYEEFKWSFGNGQYGVSEETSVLYEDIGMYRVELEQGEYRAFAILKIYESQSDFSAFIDIYDESCSPGQECEKADLSVPANEYDFFANYDRICDEGIEEEEVRWVFENTDTGRVEERTGTYIDNYSFQEDGYWRIQLLVTDACGGFASSVSYLQIGDGGPGNPPSLSIEADTTSVGIGGTINFTGISSDPDASDFVWNFGDAGTDVGENTSYTFDNPGTYTIELQSGGSTAYVTVHVGDDEEQDSDGDGVPDSGDDCPLIPGEAANNGCPIVDGDADGDGVPDSEDDCPNQAGAAANGGCPIIPGDNDGDGIPNDEDACPNQAGTAANSGCPDGVDPPDDPGELDTACGGPSGDCPDGYICSVFPGGPGQGICILDDVCSIPLDGGTSGNVTCNSCPCNFSVDFDAELKICDIVFPAITSPDGSEIYSKGPVYQILE